MRKVTLRINEYNVIFEEESYTYLYIHLTPGTFLQGGKYRIVRFIKSGGFGSTYEARHTFFDERVAIKEFFPKDFCNREADSLHVTVGTQSKKALVLKLKTKFIDEAVAIRKLSHKGIVGVRDVFEENGTAYYVMDYIDGCSLEDIVKLDGALSEQKALSYIRQISSALSYVHSCYTHYVTIRKLNELTGQNFRLPTEAEWEYAARGGKNSLGYRYSGSDTIDDVLFTIAVSTPRTVALVISAFVFVYKSVLSSSPYPSE